MTCNSCPRPVSRPGRCSACRARESLYYQKTNPTLTKPNVCRKCQGKVPGRHNARTCTYQPPPMRKPPARIFRRDVSFEEPIDIDRDLPEVF